MSKLIIDRHITENIEYYKNYCLKLFGHKKKHLADDLFQEFYLYVIEIPEETVNAYLKNDRLKYLLTKKLFGLFISTATIQRKWKCEKNPIYQISDRSVFQFVQDEDLSSGYELKNLIDVLPNHEEEDWIIKKADLILNQIKEDLQSPDNETYISALVFVQGQEHTITHISQKSNINRVTLSKLYNKAVKRYRNVQSN